MDKTRIIHDFPTVLALLSRGRFVEKLDDKLAELHAALNACPDDKAKATLTLSFDFTRLGEKVDIKPSVKLKPPEEKGFPPTTLFLADEGLSTQHPSQIDLFAGPRAATERNQS